MSTSPDTQKGENVAAPKSKFKNWNSPAFTLLKGILWIAVAIAAVTLLVMNYEIVWELLAEVVPLVFEVLEESLDTFFEKVVRLNPMMAQMATAYIGFVLLLVVLYLLVRKGIKIYRKAQAKKQELTSVYSNAWHEWYSGLQTSALNWWASLDFTNKIVAVIAFVLLGIPLALLLSFVLGSLVAQLL
jgi:hypothetical protein